MPYIGNTVQNQGFTPAIDYFSGNGVTVTFTLSRPVVSASQVICAVDNVIQNPSSAFTVSGSSITFTSAPLSGTNNIWVEYTSLITTYNAISQDPSVIGDLTASGGFLSTGDFGNSYIDGTIVDYVTGNARITTGPADGLTIYNGGTSARYALLGINSSGQVNVGTGTGKFDNAYLSVPAGISAVNSGATAPYFQTYNTNASTNLKTWRWGGDSAGALNFQTVNDAYNSATAQFSISSSGYVNMPNQVAFHVRVNNANYITTSPVPLSNAVYNIGSAWNTSTYTFTAPIGGRYMFFLQWYGRVTVANNGTSMRVIVNGSQVQYSDMTVPAGTAYLQLPFMSIFNLSTGDTVQYTWAGNAGGAYYGGNQEMNLFGCLLG